MTDLASDVSLDLHGRAIEWRIARLAKPHRKIKAAVELTVIAVLSVVIAYFCQGGV